MIDPRLTSAAVAPVTLSRFVFFSADSAHHGRVAEHRPRNYPVHWPRLFVANGYNLVSHLVRSTGKSSGEKFPIKYRSVYIFKCSCGSLAA